MSNLDDLGIPSITDMNTDEALELLRQIRLSRRVPVKKNSTRSSPRKAQQKALSNIDADQAAELLKLLGG